MLLPLQSLRAKLLLTTLVFLVILAIALVLLVVYGFRATQRTAAEQSVASLQNQGQAALRSLIEREGQFSTIYFQQPAMASRMAAEYLSGVAQIAATTDVEVVAQFTQHPEGHVTDPDHNRLSDLFVPNFLPINASTRQEIRHSLFLDALGPTLLQENPQAVAFYFVTNRGISRYYPMNGIEGVVPPDWDLTLEPWFVPTAPEANPERRTTWSPLYPDDVGNGLMITTCSPVYVGDMFEGMVCLDVTLRQMTEHLERLKLTPNSYAFLTDAEGRLIAGPDVAVSNLTEFVTFPDLEDNQTIGLTLADPQIRGIIQADTSDIQTIDLHGEPVFLATTKLADLGWHLSLVAPIAEVTEQSSFVVSAIEQGTVSTMRTTTMAMLLFFVLAVAGVTFFSMRLTRPIATVVAATQAVARGDLQTTIPVTSRDELGTLAESFNQMTHELRTARANLEQLVVERTDALNQSMRLQEEVVQQANLMLAMSTPLIPVSDQIIVMPLIGTINAERSQQVLQTLLRGVANQRAKVAILDITGVPVVDTFVAEVLIQAAQAIRLLGASVILTGIRPEAAQTLIGLGVDLKMLITRSTLQGGFEYANRMLLALEKRNGQDNGSAFKGTGKS